MLYIYYWGEGRNFDPQLTLVHMNPGETSRGLQRQVGRCIFIIGGGGRNFYPQLTLVDMNPEEASRGLQRQVGRCTFIIVLSVCYFVHREERVVPVQDPRLFSMGCRQAGGWHWTQMHSCPIRLPTDSPRCKLGQLMCKKINHKPPVKILSFVYFFNCCTYNYHPRM